MNGLGGLMGNGLRAALQVFTMAVAATSGAGVLTTRPMNGLLLVMSRPDVDLTKLSVTLNLNTQDRLTILSNGVPVYNVCEATAAVVGGLLPSEYLYTVADAAQGASPTNMLVVPAAFLFPTGRIVLSDDDSLSVSVSASSALTGTVAVYQVDSGLVPFERPIVWQVVQGASNVKSADCCVLAAINTTAGTGDQTASALVAAPTTLTVTVTVAGRDSVSFDGGVLAGSAFMGRSSRFQGPRRTVIVYADGDDGPTPVSATMAGSAAGSWQWLSGTYMSDAQRAADRAASSMLSITSAAGSLSEDVREAAVYQGRLPKLAVLAETTSVFQKGKMKVK